MMRVALAATVLAAAGYAPAALGATCSASTTPVDFGNYSVFATLDDTTTGSVRITCQHQAGDPSAATLGYLVGASTGASNSFTSRNLIGGGSKLAYNVYTTSNYTTIWGNGTAGGTATFSGSFVLNQGNPTRTRQHTVYGRIPARQDVAAGGYSDSLIVTVIW
jgi:spore coat protein U-like protein